MLFGNKTHVMGILNVTPDSFSGDGILSSGQNLEKIILEKLETFKAQNIDIIDVGGESTRPNTLYPDSKPIKEFEEISRIEPVIKIISEKVDIPISIDTTKSNVAERACKLGATIINDVSMLSDPKMAKISEKYNTFLVISHVRNEKHSNVVEEVINDLKNSIEYAVLNGVSNEKLIIDPGIGFKKSSEESVEILRNISFIKSELGFPILIGVSRKSFISSIIYDEGLDRVEGTAAAISYCITQGVDIVRVHDVKFMSKISRFTDHLVRDN